MSSLIRNNQFIINQLIDIIQQFSVEDYSKKLNILNGSSIGMHTRHILEFYTCFLKTTNSSQICYDNRDRKLIYEIDPDSSISCFKSIQNDIQKLNLESEISIQTNTGVSENENEFVQSTIGRELLYTLDHAIHHMAILKIGTQMNFNNISFPEGFGVAPSTIRHHNKCAQ